MAKYKRNLITVGGFEKASGNTEIMSWSNNDNGIFRWSEIESEFKFYGFDQALVSVPASDMNEEYVLLIGGIDQKHQPKTIPYAGKLHLFESVYKFNGTWLYFGKLNRPRELHSAIFWNGAVYVIGGFYEPER